MRRSGAVAGAVYGIVVGAAYGGFAGAGYGIVVGAANSGLSYEPRPLRDFGGLDSGGGGRVAPAMPERRWRMASYMTTAPATETLSELTLPAMGMRRRWSQVRLTRSCSPEPSLPRTRQTSWRKSKSV